MVLVSSASLTTIPPFFEPGAPPPTLPILLAQTEVGATDIPVKLLAQEEIGSGPTVARSSRSMLRYHPYPKSTRKQHPSLKPQANPTHDDDAPSGIAANETDSELTSVTDSEIESESDTPLIPKPDGEAGRPNRGGYNLEKALEWEHKKYIRVKKYVKKLVEDLLDTTKNFTSQDASGIRLVQYHTAEKFPELHGYVNKWPVTDMIRLELKYTSGRARFVDKYTTGQVSRRRDREKQ